MSHPGHDAMAHSWQPIDTAPRDGTEILASDYDAIDFVSYGEWSRGVFGWTNREMEPMFPAWWQPLPEHPPLPSSAFPGSADATP